MFATEIFALILLVRLVTTPLSNRKGVGSKAFIVTIIAIFTLYFQIDIINASKVKWNIYRQTVDTYMNDTASNTVVADLWHAANPITDYYTMHLENMFMPRDKAEKLADRKYGHHDNEADLIKIIPLSLQQQLSHSSLSSEENKNVKILDSGETAAHTLQQINEGYYYCLYHLPLLKGVQIKINYLDFDVQAERAAYIVDTRQGQLLLLSKYYKHYPLLQFDKSGFNPQKPDKKIEVLMK